MDITVSTPPRPTRRGPVVTGLAGAVLLAVLGGCGPAGTPSAAHSAGGHAAGHSVAPASPSPAPASSSAGAHGTQVVNLEATQQMRFQPASVRVRPGRITVRLHNTGSMPHRMEIHGIAGTTIPLIEGGQTKQVTFTVTRPGSYQLECAWHKGEGMTASFVVSGTS
jgi:plastocyanin